MTESVWLYF